MLKQSEVAAGDPLALRLACAGFPLAPVPDGARGHRLVAESDQERAPFLAAALLAFLREPLGTYGRRRPDVEAVPAGASFRGTGL